MGIESKGRITRSGRLRHTESRQIDKLIASANSCEAQNLEQICHETKQKIFENKKRGDISPLFVSIPQLNLVLDSSLYYPSMFLSEL